MKRLLATLILLSGINQTLVFAQGRKELARLSRDAETTMKYHEYATAIDLYQQLLKADPDNLAYNYNLGVCYLNYNQKKEALHRFEKVYAANPNHQTDLEYMLAQAYHFQGAFQEAKDHYQKAITTYEQATNSLSSSDLKGKKREEKKKEYEEKIASAKKKIQECENGISLEGQAISANIENLGAPVNSEYPDYTPLIPQDTSFLVFTSRRENTTGGRRDLGDDFFYEDIYQASKQEASEEKEKWGSPKNLNINRKYHDAGAALSADGSELYLYRDERKTKGDLYVSEYNEAEKIWEEPKKLNNNINTKYQETSLALSADGNTMYFASERPGGVGGLDIYVSKRENGGDWGPAENLGEPINTPYNDDAPFLSFDGKTLYFSSVGHQNIGGYDVFKSEKQADGTWGEPSNMGYPINGPDDDVHLVLTVDNRKGYYVSSDESGLGQEDIYSLTAPKPMLKKLDKGGLEISKPSGVDIARVNDSSQVRPPEFAFEVRFGFDQSSLSPAAKASIDNLLTYLKDNQTIRIELGGHTCNIGTQNYNTALSLRRARSVANYLIERGVDANRIETKGYAFSKPLVPNVSPVNRAKNRRTEYTIIED